MIYNFNLGIGWASSGVEYAQIYRAKMFRNIGVDAKFVFTDMFPQENIEHMTKNIGFEDSEVIWLYTFFTDFKTAPVTYTLSDLEKTFSNTEYTKSREGKICRYVFNGSNNFYTAYMVNDHDDYVHRVELVSNGCLIRKDYLRMVVYIRNTLHHLIMRHIYIIVVSLMRMVVLRMKKSLMMIV